jgi:DNA processing protein
MEPQAYWLGLTLMQGIGAIRFKQLLAFFGNDPQRVWHAPERDLQACGLPERIIQTFLSQRRQLDLSAEIIKVQKANARLLTLADPTYPPLLRELDDAPPVLYVRGELLPADQIALAVVGTRKPTRYGLEVAYRLTKQLAAAGVTIISGLAQGIDTAAHRGALDAGGRTLAILGCGIQTIYPRENTALAERIVQRGALLTEFALGTPPNAINFPRRNRILSGLARGVLIVEAPERSGALITATAAAEQGRDVFAVPGNILSLASGGTNRLIQDGAKLVLEVRDILEELHIEPPKTTSAKRLNPPKIAPTPTAATVPEPAPTVISFDSEAERVVLNVLEIDPRHVDDIVRAAGLPTAEVMAALTMLELKGLAQTTGAMQYCRTR